MEKVDNSIIAIIWAGISLIIFLSSLVTPVCQLYTMTIKYRVFFTLIICAPAVIALFVIAYNAFRDRIKNKMSNISNVNALAILIMWTLFVVLVTGGIAGSPLSSLIAIVPLISTPFISNNGKSTLLKVFFAGVIIIGFLSFTSWFAVPDKYPDGDEWRFVGQYNRIIATFVLASGVALEIGLNLWNASRFTAGTTHQNSATNV